MAQNIECLDSDHLRYPSLLPQRITYLHEESKMVLRIQGRRSGEGV